MAWVRPGLPGMATKGQGSAQPACLPILSSQLHLGVAIRLPLGSMGSHYHHHILMTPINSPSVGPLQPSVLKVKRRGTGSGWLFPRMSYRLVCVACVYKHVCSLPLRCLCIKAMFIFYWFMCVHVCTLSVCIVCIQNVYVYKV